MLIFLIKIFIALLIMIVSVVVFFLLAELVILLINKFDNKKVYYIVSRPEPFDIVIDSHPEYEEVADVTQEEPTNFDGWIDEVENDFDPDPYPEYEEVADVTQEEQEIREVKY